MWGLKASVCRSIYSMSTTGPDIFRETDFNRLPVGQDIVLVAEEGARLMSSSSVSVGLEAESILVDKGLGTNPVQVPGECRCPDSQA